ncbi:MAG: AAA family ATPase [Actinomycetota bacterium]|jgi:RecA-family ATPase
MTQHTVRRLLVRDSYGQDSGELKTLKSYFGLARIVGLAAGVPILGQWPVPERRRVLAYVAEGGRKPWTRRFIRMCEAHGVDPADLNDWVTPIFELLGHDVAVWGMGAFVAAIPAGIIRIEQPAPPLAARRTKPA